jgi:hypothetical protein
LKRRLAALRKLREKQALSVHFWQRQLQCAAWSPRHGQPPLAVVIATKAETSCYSGKRDFGE